MRCALRIVVLACGWLGVSAAPALADTAQSSNWAGYAVHRPGVQFTKVIAAWKQPKAACVPGSPTYSAVWVGLGGYSASSEALEQIGSEVDCTGSGRIASSAWYELVPAPSSPIRLMVRPGDALEASVVVSGHKVTLVLDDLTRHRTYRKSTRAAQIDISSAEWIVEAPSECLSANQCRTLPLANFGSATFGLAGTESSSGHTGSISDPGWDTTKISLTPDGRHFVVYNAGASGAAATPSDLTGTGNSFRVTYSRVSATRGAQDARAVALKGGYIVHGTR